MFVIYFLYVFLGILAMRYGLKNNFFPYQSLPSLSLSLLPTSLTHSFFLLSISQSIPTLLSLSLLSSSLSLPTVPNPSLTLGPTSLLLSLLSDSSLFSLPTPLFLLRPLPLPIFYNPYDAKANPMHVCII